MSILAYWLPIAVSAAVVFVVSAIIWMALKWHNSDYQATADEAAVRAALKGAAPGMYIVPYCMEMSQLGQPEMQQKFVDGPVAYIKVVPNGPPTMGGKLLGSFLFYLLVGVLCAYILSLSVTADASYLEVFQVAGAVAFIAHGIAYFQESIWFGRPWSVTAKNLLDALIYALFTGGVFGWLA